jgi:hypothetical protein
MSRRARVLGLVIAVALFTLSFLTSRGSGAADDKDLKDTILKLANALEKNDPAASKKLVDQLKEADLGDIMVKFKLRSKGGLGVGPKPDAVKPDGIEDKLRALGKKTDKKELTNHSADFAQMAYVMAAVAEVAGQMCPVEQKTGDKDPKEWKQWVEEVKTGSRTLAAAAKAQDAEKVKVTAQKIYAACNDCHGKFRD